jgi:LuxR family maltose regulon positive regulatory protein
MPDALVMTKVRVPRTRTELVPRPRLREALVRYEERRLTLVSAPAGFGKTTLLGEWFEDHAGDGRSVAWLSLEEADNDPARFLAYLVSALRSALGEGIGEGVLASLRLPEFPPVEAVVGVLINELAEVQREEVTMRLLLSCWSTCLRTSTSSSPAARTRPSPSPSCAPGTR